LYLHPVETFLFS